MEVFHFKADWKPDLGRFLLTTAGSVADLRFELTPDEFKAMIADAKEQSAKGEKFVLHPGDGEIAFNFSNQPDFQRTIDGVIEYFENTYNLYAAQFLGSPVTEGPKRIRSLKRK
jgi:hypothetical protein